MVGLLAEPLPPGFGFSETAFRIFVLMASRRLKTDRFFTDDYRPEVYSAEGMRWIEDASMAAVIERHVAGLDGRVSALANPFAPGTPREPPVSGRAIHAITDGTAGRVHAFLLDWGDGLTLIDALSGAEGAASSRGSAASAGVGDLQRIVLTHAHRSHVRGAARMRALSGAGIHADPLEASVMRRRAALGADRLLAAPPAARLPPPGRAHPRLRTSSGPGSASRRSFANPPFEVDQEIGRDGDTVGGLQVVRTPGHTDGSLSFYWPAQRALFTGDVLVTWPRLEIGWAGLTTDMAGNRRSLRRARDGGGRRVHGNGHGPPLVDDAAARIRDLLAGVPPGGPRRRP